MHGWFVGAEIVLLVVLLLILPLVVLALRRRWLARQGGTFECSLRLSRPSGSGWALGVARYNAENLEWFRFFSYSVRPRKTFVRNDVNVLDSREPDPVEAVSLYAGQQIVRIETKTDDLTETWDLAMSGESLTGLLSWLEAAPPGAVAY